MKWSGDRERKKKTCDSRKITEQVVFLLEIETIIPLCQ